MPDGREYGMVTGMRVIGGAWLFLSAILLAAAPLGAEEEGSNQQRAATDDERIAWRQGVVTIEREGKRLAIGTVLNGDGRILTLLSALGHGNDLYARYWDGSATRLQVSLFDRAWDIALLKPLDEVSPRGLRAARRAVVGEALKRLVIQGKTVHLGALEVEGQRTLIGHDGARLEGALVLSGQMRPWEGGSPIISESTASESRGKVMAIVARACAPNKKGASEAPCRLVPYGVPVEALRAFLKDAPAFKAPRPWLGVEVLPAEGAQPRGAIVKKVIPKSPAAAAGLRAEDDHEDDSGENHTGKLGDVIVAVDGKALDTPRELLDIVSAHAVGDELELLVFRAGQYRKVGVVLGASPSPNAATSNTNASEASTRATSTGKTKR